MIIQAILILLGSFVLLVKGSDIFVESSSKIAKKLGVSEFIIGLTLVAIGTSVPEMATSIMASIKGDSGLIIGNIIGSNIANIGLILSVGAIITTIDLKKKMLTRDGSIMLFGGIIFFLLAFDRVIGKMEGVLFLLIFVSYIMFLINTKNKKDVYHLEDFLDYVMNFKYLRTIRDRPIKQFIKNKSVKAKKEYIAFKEGLTKDSLLLVLGGIALVFGAKYLIIESIWFGNFLKIPTSIIGISIIAIGTSIPELSVSLRAAKKGMGDMVLGNIIGSNIANTLLILGISGIIRPLIINSLEIFFMIPIMIFIFVALIYFMRTKLKISKIEGITLLLIYLIFISTSFFIGR